MDEKIPFKFAQKIIDQFKKDFLIENQMLSLTLSIGIALYPKDGAGDLLRKADAALYYVKNHGKNNFVFFNAINTY